MGTQSEPSGAGRFGRGGARERSEGWPPGRPERSGLCADEGGGSDVLKLDDALAQVDDFVAEKLGV
mgnify:CR=1 FL=1